jgi:DNA-binding MarR family transcriptional regulator
MLSTLIVSAYLVAYGRSMSTKTTLQDADPLSLERQVCFALAITNRAVLAVYRPLLEPLGLTHPQYLVMLALWGHPRSSPEPLSVKQIAAALQLDSATLSPMLKRLEVLGLITRSRGTTDERTTHVELTADGVALRRRALKIPPAVVERLGVDLDELERLHEVLTRINAAALAAGALADEGTDR